MTRLPTSRCAEAQRIAPDISQARKALTTTASAIENAGKDNSEA